MALTTCCMCVLFLGADTQRQVVGNCLPLFLRQFYDFSLVLLLDDRETSCELLILPQCQLYIIVRTVSTYFARMPIAQLIVESLLLGLLKCFAKA